MVLCGQHSSPSLWTTEVSLLLTNDIFLSISSSYENSRSQPICQDVRIVKKVLSLLRPMLLAPTFRCNPAATTCYGWLLKKMEVCYIHGTWYMAGVSIVKVARKHYVDSASEDEQKSFFFNSSFLKYFNCVSSFSQFHRDSARNAGKGVEI